jgi:excisionase family DNA binding protein
MTTRTDEERPLLVNIETAARLLGISRSEAYQLAAQGALPTVKFGRAVRVHRGQLEKWADEQARGARGGA